MRNASPVDDTSANCDLPLAGYEAQAGSSSVNNGRCDDALNNAGGAWDGGVLPCCSVKALLHCEELRQPLPVESGASVAVGASGLWLESVSGFFAVLLLHLLACETSSLRYKPAVCAWSPAPQLQCDARLSPLLCTPASYLHRRLLPCHLPHGPPLHLRPDLQLPEWTRVSTD